MSKWLRKVLLTKQLGVALIAAAACAGCTSGGNTGDLQVSVSAEDSITTGIAAGVDSGSDIDGWNISYTHFLANVGNVTATVSTNPVNAHHDASFYVVDLKSLPTTLVTIAEFTSIPGVLYDRIGYDIAAATSESVCDQSVSVNDCAAMKANALALDAAGTITKGTQVVHFNFKVPAGEHYGECTTPDGMDGLSVASGGVTSAQVTVHGDHWFFTRYPTGDEAQQPIYLCAEWLAETPDVDSDGVITKTDLMARSVVDAFPLSARSGWPANCVYDFSGFPSNAVINNAWDYVVAMARSLGHFQVEGDCNLRESL